MKFLVFGLGNPGSEYADTRHNIGFMVLDRLCRDLGSLETFATRRYASVASGKQAGKHFLLVKPQTYMNLSGQAVRYWMQTEKLEVERILVITDDISLPYGQIRLRGSGSAGGHNGLGHIETVLGHNSYPRLRVGIGRDFGSGRQSDYVLSCFEKAEQEDLPALLERCSQAAMAWALRGLGPAMNEFNRS
ncbi:MAG: aminoacyl-tRNA hydrolase [Sphingomonadales bacterium]|nr:aminoacyl-tRNA hydrolase [Sphingomonadales bacterium]